MKEILLAADTVLALSLSFTVNAVENDRPQYLSDWWHRSVNVIGSYYTRLGLQIRSDTYLGYGVFARKDWFDFCGYAGAPIFFGSNSDAKSIWNHGFSLFMEIEPHFSIDRLTNTDPSFDLLKEWHLMNNYIYSMGRNKDGRQSTWYMGLGADIDTGLPMGLPMNVYAKYQWQDYGVANENEQDGHHFKVKYFVPITDLWDGQLNYIGLTDFGWGSDLGDDSGNVINGTKTRASNSIASNHILALNYDHWHYSVVTRYWHDGDQWNDDAELNLGNGNFNVRSTNWGGYLVIGYNF